MYMIPFNLIGGAARDPSRLIPIVVVIPIRTLHATLVRLTWKVKMAIEVCALGCTRICVGASVT
jgi:hypothetical protein